MKKVILVFAISFLLVLVIGGFSGVWSHAIAITYMFMSMVTLVVYKWDKRLAITATSQAVRVPERSLHILAILCGWPGALIAQQWFRHKSKKRSFIILLWLTTSVNCSALLCAYYFL